MNREDIARIYTTLRDWGMTPNQRHFSAYWMGEGEDYLQGAKAIGIRPTARLARRLKSHAEGNPIVSHAEWLQDRAADLARAIEEEVYGE